MPPAGAGAPKPGRNPASYRDPAGFVFTRDGRLYRQVNGEFAADWGSLRQSGLLGSLWDRQLLVRHEDADLSLRSDDRAIAVLAPERVPVITYPYEWTFSQLQDAALLTLEAQAVAEKHGMTLRDATAYNVAFLGQRPILIDTLSFKRVSPDRPWEPYRQFCEHFLGPLALMATRDPRLGLLVRDFTDGIPLDLISALLPVRTRFSPGIGAHIHLHARAQRKQAGRESEARDASMSPGRRAALLDHLRRTVSSLSVNPQGTTWAHYADNTSYDDTSADAKAATVRAMLTRLAGSSAIDVGANTGRFSTIASELGYTVVAPDVDWAAAERHYRALRERGDARVLPMVADIASPSPSLGWAGRERAGLLERLRADVVMALALVHHLAIGRNVPLASIAEVFAQLAPHLIIEWVPKHDPMVARLLAVREDVFPEYTIAGFRSAFDEIFEVLDEQAVGNSQRALFLMRRR